MRAQQTRSGAHDRANAPRLGMHDRGILSRQTSYSGKKKKKKGPPRIRVSQKLLRTLSHRSHIEYIFSISRRKTFVFPQLPLIFL